MTCTKNIKALAERGHQGQFRKDGSTPAIEHPRAVVALLESWDVDDDVTLAIAWGHDLLEDTRVTPEEILAKAGPRHGKEVLEGIRLLTRDPVAHPSKADWLKHVAKVGGLRELLVKSADRICNTRDFLALGDPAKARSYLAEGAPVFAMVPDAALAEKIAGELEKVRGEIDAAEKPAITELYFILDRSGSMSSMVPATISGFNEMLEKQRRETQGELFVSTLLFADANEVLHNHIPVADVRPLTEREYVTGGCTALYDALGDAITHAVNRQRYAPESRRARNVVFVVITDGYENASRRYRADAIRAMVEKEIRDYDWQFLYLGANIDAFAAAGHIGIDQAHTANFVADGAGVLTNFAAVENAVSFVRHCASPFERSRHFRSGLWKKDIDEDFEKRGKKGK